MEIKQFSIVEKFPVCTGEWLRVWKCGEVQIFRKDAEIMETECKKELRAH
jgi:hypothetical protein